MENIRESVNYIIDNTILLYKHQSNISDFCKQKFIEKFKDSPQEKYTAYQSYEIINPSKIRIFYTIKGFVYNEHFDIEI